MLKYEVSKLAWFDIFLVLHQKVPNRHPGAQLERVELEVNLKNALLRLGMIYELYFVVKRASSEFEKTPIYPSLQLFLSLVT